jgi:hypothetical protein
MSHQVVAENKIFRVVLENRYGKIVELDDDAYQFHLEPNQHWLPRAVKGPSLPFKSGDIVALNSFLCARLKITVGIVSRTRTFKYTRRGWNVHSQIELAGFPLEWFSVLHFTHC